MSGPRTIVVGAGVIGAACAWALARAGAQVTLVEAAAAPGQGCSAASFGWLNLSVSGPGDDLELRARALAAARAAPGFADRRGALVWEQAPEATEALFARLRPHDPAARMVAAAEAAALAPELRAPPALAVFAPDEGAVEPTETAALLLAAARASGALGLLQAPVQSLLERSGRVAGVVLGGPDPRQLEADHVVLAAGAASARLLAPLAPEAAAGLGLSPSVLVRVPGGRALSRILCGPELEARATPCGDGVAPGAAIVTAEDPPADAADPAALRAFAERRAEALRDLLHTPFAPRAGAPARALLAQRPMPATRPFAPLDAGVAGLTLACAHPGVIFAPFLAARVAARVAGRAA
ncbi:FAD-dependent oxidoreductase [Albimonas pacifica]|uniref:Glycine/D-amino acid oxidase n=1 Tax=Albimonas pacifica TaxID=1114924 RepID=A0A1I3HQ18_9RHOB|nr:FAD-dependent oxidoreductase [Albimonas pacifica]SFI37834.1 Glycine/D-amino acid oxidase [Albimonas pacifica]